MIVFVALRLSHLPGLASDTFIYDRVDQLIKERYALDGVVELRGPDTKILLGDAARGIGEADHERHHIQIYRRIGPAGPGKGSTR